MVGELTKYNRRKGVGIITTFNEDNYYCYGHGLKLGHTYKFRRDKADDEIARDLREVTMPFSIRRYSLTDNLFSLVIGLILCAIMVVFLVKTVHAEELSTDDIQLMAKLVHSEAGNQDLLGRRLVADVILNRMEHEDFPDTVVGVVFQPGQFSVISNGSFYSAKADETDYQAVELELKQRTNSRVLFFRTKHFSKYGDPCLQIGEHYFS